MTVHCWGERAAGEWTLEIQDTPSQVRSPAAQGKGTKPQGALPKVGKKPQMLLCKGWAEPAAGPCPPSFSPLVNLLQSRARFPKLHRTEAQGGKTRAVIFGCLFGFTAGTSAAWAGLATAA